MERIITLTINPALDKSITVPELVPEKKLRASDAKSEPGGGGVNVSRALHKLGIESTAVYFSGGYTGKHFDELLSTEGIDTVPLTIAGDTRENFIVVDTSSNKQYRFGMEGPELPDKEWQQALDYLQDQNGISYLVVSGSLAPGVPPLLLKRIAVIAKQKNARLIVDTSGKALEQAVNEGVFLLKPNLGELAGLSGKEKLSVKEIEEAAKNIIEKGGCEMMAISMGADGAMLVTAGECYCFKAPSVEMHSTVGAGDSMVAGMITALTRNWAVPDILRYGIACGTAATMNPGTGLCKKEDADRLFQQMKQE